jgi:hypothetical protein
MTDLFYSPHMTLVRAQHHIRDFNKSVEDFINSKPWTPFVDKKSQPGKDICKIKFTSQLPNILPCILFDAVSNLRAVLDQAGYAAAFASGKPEAKATSFPFGDDLAGLENNIKGRKVCKDIPTEIVTLFRGFKPYKGGDNTLWALNKLCNAKKHCALVPAQISNVSGVLVRESYWQGSGGSFISPSGVWDAQKHELTLTIIQSGTTLKMESHFIFAVAIQGIEVLKSAHAPHVLNAMSGIVERVLLATEAECRRLGFDLGA